MQKTTIHAAPVAHWCSRVAPLALMLGLLLLLTGTSEILMAAPSERGAVTTVRLPLDDGSQLWLPEDPDTAPSVVNPTTGAAHPLTAPANLPRQGYAATRLAEGHWLLWGGFSRPGQAAPDPVLFNPTQAQFERLTGLTAVPRAGHTATTLADGRVLILGGRNLADTTGASLAPAELYDPRAGRCQALEDFPLSPRAGQGAQLLLDGRLLVVGGTDALGTLSDAVETWDPARGERQVLARAATLAQLNPRLSLLPDGRVWVAPKTGQGESLDAQVIDPETGTVAPLSVTESRRLAESSASAPTFTVTASYPPAATSGFPVDGTLGLRFSHPLDPRTATIGTVTLVGQEGEVAVGLTLDASHQVLWVKPRQDLFPDAHYALFMDGVADAQGVPLTFTSLEFTTAALGVRTSTEGAEAGSTTRVTGTSTTGAQNTSATTSRAATSTVQVAQRVATGAGLASQTTYGDEAFVPTLRRPGQLWMTGRPLPDAVRLLRDNDPKVKAHQAKVERHRQAAQGGGLNLRPETPEAAAIQATHTSTTELSGVVLKLNDQPLAGVVVSIQGRETRTDAAGRFRFIGLESGQHVLFVDGTGGGKQPYGQSEIGVDLQPNAANGLTYAVYLPRVRPEDWIDLPAPANRDLVVTHPAMPGFELNIPKGAVLRDRGGKILTRIAVTPIPLDRTPFPTPMAMAAYFNVQPAGIRVQGLTREAGAGIRVSYANATLVKPGRIAEFWNYEPGGRGWYVYGNGKPNAAGTQIVAEPGVGLYDRMVSGINIPDGPLPPSNAPPPGGGCGGGGNDSSISAGDPVDCGTGLFLLQRTDLALTDILPIRIDRTYRPNDSVVRAFGKGANHPYGLYLITSGPAADPYAQATLVLPDGGRVVYPRIAGFIYDGIWEHKGSPSVFLDSRLQFDTRESFFNLRLKTGEVYQFSVHGEGLMGYVDRSGNRLAILTQGGLLQRITSPSGRYVDITHDADGRIIGLVDNAGRRVSYEYNDAGWLSAVTDPLGNMERYAYDAAGRMTQVIDRRGNTQVVNTYDAQGRVTRQVIGNSPDDSLDVNATWNFVYTTDANGRITRTDITNPLGVARRLEFNSAGYLVKATNGVGTALQRVTTFERGTTSNLVTARVDPLNRRTAYAYDGSGNLTALTHLAGTAGTVTKRMTYTANLNLLTSYSDGLGQTWRFTYTNGQLSAITDPLGKITSFINNAAGQRVKATDPNGNVTSLGYDLYDLYTVTDALGRVTRQLTDGLGRTLVQVDPLGNRTLSVWDVGSRLTQQTDALNQITRFSYDPLDNLLFLQDARGSTTAWRYDANNRMVERTDPLGQLETFQYDKGDHVLRHVDRRGRASQYAYDALERLTKATYPDSTVTNSYDLGDRLLSVTDSLGGALTFTYDGLDRRLTETSPRGTLTYAYDAASRRISMQVTGQPAITYTYDGANRLLKMVRGTGTLTNVYDAGGRLTTRTLPNGVVATYQYDKANQLLGISYQKGTTVLGNVTYAYDAAGRRVSQGGSLVTSRLPSAKSGADYDANHRLIAWAGKEWSYDDVGNLVSDGTQTYEWDARDRLTKIKNGTGTVLASFAYDGLNRRSQKTLGTQVTRYLHDGLNPVQELNGSNAVTANLWTGLGLDDFIGRIQSTNTRYYLPDALGSTRALANETGVIATRYAYDPYGAVTRIGEASTNPFQYTGRENDGTGLYYYRARYYHPQAQRFIAEDPIGLEGGVNPYSYVDENPVSLIDPLGLDAYICDKPLDALGGTGTKSGPDWDTNPFHHRYICVVVGNKRICGGQDRSGNPIFSPGKPSDDHFNPDRCRKKDDRKCMDSCLTDSIQNPARPDYGIGPQGTDCQEWANDTFHDCLNKCDDSRIQ